MTRLAAQPSSSSGGGAILGYKFQLTHRAITHDYRVSNDSALVVLLRPEINPVQRKRRRLRRWPSQYSNRLCGEAATAGPYLRSRINVGMEAEAVGGNLNMRGQPSTVDAQVLVADPGSLAHPYHRRPRMRRGICLVAGAGERADGLHRGIGRWQHLRRAQVQRPRNAEPRSSQQAT